jgi:hypothetical protein
MRHLSKLTLAIGAIALASALLAASALAKAPAPGYEDFAGCPSPEENPEVLLCSKTVIKGGHFQMGSKDVPITNPITLTGGALQGSGNFVANKSGGMTPVRQTVPGGIVGLTGLNWLVEFLNIEQLKLYAVTELAGTPGSPFEQTLKLPIRVHLENPVLGNNCYVGTFTNPINLDLTVQTTNPPPPNKPITGTTPVEENSGRAGVFLLGNGAFVDNAFAAPGASGCQLNLGLIHIGIDSLVNLQSGLPSPAGTNETVQKFDEYLSPPFVVYH